MNLLALARKDIGVLVGDDCNFSRISIDSRTIEAGDVFLALKGENFDGHNYLEQAKDKGAIAYIVEHTIDTTLPFLVVDDTTKALGDIAAEHRRGFSGKVVAITGSSGKTTVKGMLRAICEASGTCLSTQGNFNNHIGVPLTLLRLNNNYQYAVVEAGTSGEGEIHYLTEIIDPDIALVVNVMPAHLEGFGSVEAIAREKASIYGGASGRSEVVVNLDDANRGILMEQLGAREITGFSISADSRFPVKELVKASDLRLDALQRASFSVTVGAERLDIRLAVFGEHNVQNALAAIACAVRLGVDSAHIKSGLEAYSGDTGRMQTVKGINGATVIDDSYNANPGSMKAAIDYLAGFDCSVLVCGEMGELGSASSSLHREIGEYAKDKGIAQLFCVGSKTKDVAEAFGCQAHVFDNKALLVDALKPQLAPNMVVMVKGSRSSKMETIVEAVTQTEGVN